MPDLIVQDPNGVKRVVPLNKMVIRLGKKEDNDVVVDHVESSRYHAEIECNGPLYVLRDLDSTNGTRINGERIEGPTPLKHGSVFSIGGYMFTVRLRGDAGLSMPEIEDHRRKAMTARLGRQLHGADLVGLPLGKYLERARALKASDLHLTTGAVPFVRINGQILELEHPKLEAADVDRFAKEVLRNDQIVELKQKPDFDLTYETEAYGRFRANVHRHAHGLGMNFRCIAEKIPSLTELGLPDQLRQFTHYHQGIVLVTGPSGCGKSSTLAALVDILNTERKRQIICIEDPIEFAYTSKMSTVIQRQVRSHTAGWVQALRAALREDPDVIVVGELRDLEAISVAITAAETGHLVLGTLPTVGAIKTIDRILDSYPHQEQARIRVMISESLRGVISQHLVPAMDGSRLYPALEVLFTTPAVSNLIRESKTYQITSVIQTGQRMGMCQMDDSLFELMSQGKITRTETMARAEDPKRIEALEEAKERQEKKK